MKKTDLAYLAGVLDSDGTIGVKKSTYAVRVTKDSKQPTYSERLSVRQVAPQAVDLFRDLFGGSRYLTKSSAKRGKSLQTWAATDLRAATVLRSLRPHIRIKALQADNALSLRIVKDKSKKVRVARGRGHQGSAPRPAELSTLMEQHYQTAKRLNRVGV